MTDNPRVEFHEIADDVNETLSHMGQESIDENSTDSTN